MLEYRHLFKVPEKRTLIKAIANDLGRLAQVIGKCILSGTNTILFVKHSDVPANIKVSYVQLVASICPNKTETHRVRVTASGEVFDYPGITATDTVILTTTKMLLNSVISTLYEMFMTEDIKYFY